MADPKGFIKVKREPALYRPVCERVKDYQEVMILPPEETSQRQASRCMDCGTPFCHWSCPVGNYIPEWNDYLYKKNWQKAYEMLAATNNLPEITGRLCPALCEFSCCLGINDDPVTIRENELAIIEHAFACGWVKPQPPQKRTGKRIAVVGSGPAGICCAAQLNSAGHKVVVFERDNKCGGLLRYGIPDFKLEKWVIDRRLEVWKKEGIEFITNTEVSKDYPLDKLLSEFDAIVFALGSRQPRDLKIPGRNLDGIHFALDFLIQANKKVSGEKIEGSLIEVENKNVVVIGGGDTGADCVGVANREGAKCVVQIELLPKPPECRTDDYPWPKYPLLLKTSTSHEEGAERKWSILTKEFIGENGKVKKIRCTRVEFSKNGKNSCPLMREVEGSEFEIDTDIVILAIGFLHPEHKIPETLNLQLDKRGNILTSSFATSQGKIFACGDARRGQSLIVWAISEGRQCAHYVDKYLMGKSRLPAI